MDYIISEDKTSEGFELDFKELYATFADSEDPEIR